MVGAKLGQKPGHYYVALTIHPEEKTRYAHVGTQTTEDDHVQEADPGQRTVHPLRLPLIYAEVVSNKSDASSAVQRLLAKVRDDHGHLPDHVAFRLPSNKRAGVPLGILGKVL